MFKEREDQNHVDQVAVIRLKGNPYHQEQDGKIIDCTDTLEVLAKNSNYELSLRQNIKRNLEHLAPLVSGGYGEIDRKLKKGQSLTYDEAFSIMTYASAGVNKQVFAALNDLKIPEPPFDPEKDEHPTAFYRSFAIVNGLAMKESFAGLTPSEIAGLTAATLELDTVTRISAPSSVFGIGGMGGDDGYKNESGFKPFSLSTLGAVILANFGYVHKHHSYPNTSPVSGQGVIEQFGARSNQSSPQELEHLLETTGLVMTSCHTIRTIHTISHLIKGETINHIVGPLAIPVNRDVPVSAFIGVNNNVHPETVTGALKIMQEKGIQRYENSVAFCGLNSDVIPEHFNPKKYYQNFDAKRTIAIDEVAPPPYATLAAFLIKGNNIGAYIIKPEDFMEDLSSRVNIKLLTVPKTIEGIMGGNYAAIEGKDLPKSLYLAMTAALALFTKEYASLPNAFDQKYRKVNRTYLREAFQRSLEVIMSGKAYNKLQEYVIATGGRFN